MRLSCISLPTTRNTLDDVFFLCAPSEILDPVIGRIVVSVETNLPRKPWPDKSFKYCSVHPNSFLLPLSTSHRVEVAIAVRGTVHFLTSPFDQSIRSADEPIYAAYAAGIRHLVIAFPTRDWPPCFFHLFPSVGDCSCQPKDLNFGSALAGFCFESPLMRFCLTLGPLRWLGGFCLSAVQVVAI